LPASHSIATEVGPIAASWLIVDGNFATVTGTALLYRSSRAH